MADPVSELLAERDIRRVVLRYCRGVDRLDLDLVRSCFHHDATDSHGSFAGGVDELLAWLARVLGRYTSTMHLVGNLLVEPDEADDRRARAETYGVAFHRHDTDDDPRRNLVTGFRYVDDLERRESGPTTGWRIVRRVAVTEWVRVDRREDRWPIPDGMLVGARDRTDAVYGP